MQLSDTRAIITGGVSGLGLAVARHLVAHGAKVALLDVNEAKGAEAVAELGDGNARFFATDVTNEAGVVANVCAKKTWMPCDAKTRAVYSENCRPPNRVSWPITALGLSP